MLHYKFGTAINCIDGRVQTPVAEWLKFHHHVQYVDMITEPGADKVLSTGYADKISAIAEKLRISMEVHNSRIVAVVGHFDCAANPVEVNEHQEQIKDGTNLIISWNTGIRVIGLYVNEWNSIDLICDSNEDYEELKSYL